MNTQIAAQNMLTYCGERSVSVSCRSLKADTTEHALWMLEGIAEGYISGEKAHRWIGYAQAILVFTNIGTLEAFKKINKES